MILYLSTQFQAGTLSVRTFLEGIDIQLDNRVKSLQFSNTSPLGIDYLAVCCQFHYKLHRPYKQYSHRLHQLLENS